MTTIPPGMTPEKLETIAGYVSVLDRMTIDLDNERVTFHPPRDGESEMQDDLRGWAAHIRDRCARLRIPIDLNVRVKGNQAMAGFEDVPGMVATGDQVEIYEAESGLHGLATVSEIDSEKRLIYMITDWHLFEEAQP